MKTHADLIKCTKLPEDTEICFLDDVFYPDMNNEKIYYINVKPYVYDLELNEMITRLLNSDILGAGFGDPTYCREFMLEFMKRYNYTYVGKTTETQNVDKIVSKKMLHHLHNFFKIQPTIGTHTHKILNKTKRNKPFKNKTLKIHYN
jgi:hypothetical protein